MPLWMLGCGTHEIIKSRTGKNPGLMSKKPLLILATIVIVGVTVVYLLFFLPSSPSCKTSPTSAVHGTTITAICSGFPSNAGDGVLAVYLSAPGGLVVYSTPIGAQSSFQIAVPTTGDSAGTYYLVVSYPATVTYPHGTQFTGIGSFILT